MGGSFHYREKRKKKEKNLWKKKVQSVVAGGKNDRRKRAIDQRVSMSIKSLKGGKVRETEESEEDRSQ